jgi:hypothetical protein
MMDVPTNRMLISSIYHREVGKVRIFLLNPGTDGSGGCGGKK